MERSQVTGLAPSLRHVEQELSAKSLISGEVSGRRHEQASS